MGGALLVFVIIFASLTSTLDCLLAASADLLAEDVYLQMLRPQASDQQLRLVARLLVVALGFLTMLLSWRYVTSMFQLLLFTGALVASTIWPIAPYCAALMSAAVSALVMGLWSHCSPERFSWSVLAESPRLASSGPCLES